MIEKGLKDLTTTVQLPDNPGITTLKAADTPADIISAMWGISASTAKEIANTTRVYSSKHGLFASIPIVCKKDACGYKDVCMVKKNQRIIGNRCPMEIGAILSRFEQYCRKFNIDISMECFKDEDLVDATLIKDLINIEITMIRAENKIALSGDFMAQTLLDIDKKCNPYFGEIVSPESEFLLKLQDKKTKILNQLNATRKDIASTKKLNTAGGAAIKLFQQITDAIGNTIEDISDMDFSDSVEYVEDASVKEDQINIATTINGEVDGEMQEPPEKVPVVF